MMESVFSLTGVARFFFFCARVTSTDYIIQIGITQINTDFSLSPSNNGDNVVHNYYACSYLPNSGVEICHLVWVLETHRAQLTKESLWKWFGPEPSRNAQLLARNNDST